MIVPCNQRTRVRNSRVASASAALQLPPPPRQAYIVSASTRPEPEGLVPSPEDKSVETIGAAHHEAPDHLAKKGNN